MAIRFLHQAGAGLIGAYASGLASAGQRRQKYVLDLWQQDRQHQMRLDEIGARWGNRAGAGGLGQQAGTWTDPLADNPKAGTDTRILLRAERERRDQLARLGKEVPSKWQRSFTPAPTKEDVRHGQRMQMSGLEHEQQMAMERIRQTGRADAESLGNLRKAGMSLPQIPEHADAEIRKWLGERASFIRKVLLSGEHDLSDPGTLNRLVDAIDDYHQGVEAIPQPDPNESLWVVDPISKRYRRPTEGEPGTHVGSPGEIPQPLPEYEREQEKAAEAKEKAEQANQARIKDLERQREKYETELRQLRGLDAPSDKQKTEIMPELKEKIAKLDEKLKGLESPEPEPNTATSMEDVPNPKTKKEFDALPSGAIFIDPNGIKRRKP